MNNKIIINSGLENKIEELMLEKEKISIIFETISKKIDDLPNDFDGKTGKEAYRRLSIYRKRFDKILDSIDNKIIFLSDILKAYEGADDIISKLVDDYL